MPSAVKNILEVEPGIGDFDAQVLTRGAGVTVHRAGAAGEAMRVQGDALCVNCLTFM